MRGGGESGEGGTTATKKGPWTAAEDAILSEYVRMHGEGNWNAVQKNTCLLRCGKSCRLRWANHLRPDLKKGCFTHEEELVVLRLHAQMGNKWARMAALLPGRTDNDIKNYWNTRVKRRHRAGLALYPPNVATPPPTPTAAAAAPLSGFSPHFPQNPFKPLFTFPLSPVSPHTPFDHHHHHESFDLSPIPVLPLPVNPELPSNQYFNRTASSGGGGGDGAGGELLDALLHEQQRGTLLAESAGLGRDHMWGPLGVGGGSSCGWGRPALDSVSKLDGSDVCFGIKTQIGVMHQDISTLLDMIPGTSAASAVPEWYNSPSGEMSNVPSSSSIVTDHDDIGLEMRQLASSPSINAAANWELSGSWNNPSGICL